ncbi:MAG: hypothetical protein U9Q07_14330, partial [Planctomycetota bacterium]|nr:hypothetical protein [Planctomycetota bacterium]
MKTLKTTRELLSALTLAGFIILVGALSPWSDSLAKTTVTQSDECSFKVTVEIAFAFLDQGSRDKADDLLKTWIDQMSQTWNGPNGHQTFGDCDCRVTFEFITMKLPVGQNCRNTPAGYHCINVVDQPTNQRGNRADAHTVPPNGNWNGYGEWTTRTTGTDAAHELGHLMGLTDEYHYDDKDGDGTPDTYVNDNVQTDDSGKPADPQSLMAQTWGNVAALQEHIDSIMNQAGQTCPTSCCCGNGEVDEAAPVNEDCDPKATPNGCEENLECTDQCKCVAPPEDSLCGDGEITEPEECDPAMSPTGCADDKKCVGCKCQERTEPPPPSETPAPEAPDEPIDGTADTSGDGNENSLPECGDQLCDPSEDCSICPADCGECPPECGNNTCEESEGCDSCPADCACEQNELCIADECILPECFGDDQCNDDAPCTADMCRYPGTGQSYCSYQTIEVCVALFGTAVIARNAYFNSLVT